jgi:hypothetical protein
MDPATVALSEGLEPNEPIAISKLDRILTSCFEHIKKRQQDEIVLVPDFEVTMVAMCLRDCKFPLAESPRIYIILRLLDAPAVAFDEFVNYGAKDTALPFENETLPSNLDSEFKTKFLEMQNTVVSLGMRVEKGEYVVTEFDTLGFERESSIGQRDPAWLVESSYSRKMYLVLGKRIPPHAFSEREWNWLKGFQHPHIFTLVGAFGNMEEVCYVLSPPAEIQLSAYLNLALKANAEDRTNYQKALKSFFGCLASGLEFLQRFSIDVTVSIDTIFIYKGKVLYQGGVNPTRPWLKPTLTSRSDRFSVLSYTTTTTRSYYPPEISYDYRLYPPTLTPFLSSDMLNKSTKWLGLVFLNILAVLGDKQLVDVVPLPASIWTENPRDWELWGETVAQLEQLIRTELAMPLECAKIMLRLREHRNTTLELKKVVDRIRQHEMTGNEYSFCGPCCRNPVNQDDKDSSPINPESINSATETSQTNSMETQDRPTSRYPKRSNVFNKYWASRNQHDKRWISRFLKPHS